MMDLKETDCNNGRCSIAVRNVPTFFAFQPYCYLTVYAAVPLCMCLKYMLEISFQL